MNTPDSQVTAKLQPANAPGRAEIPVEGRVNSDTTSGENKFLSWGARSDVGLVRSHNEDSFLVRAPLFVVSDGMGGHAAGEVASSIAVETINEKAPPIADDILLGAAVESANTAVIQAAEDGLGKPGMGCTASCILIENSKMAVAHVGDSRVYLLRHGTLVRITHDHSFVEELVDSGQITPDEARTHPSRSIITRALGSDPDMYADHFSLEVMRGDRIILCSDGLTSMIPDSELESVAVSSATAQQAADNLVSAALTAGGSDNITVIVVDVLDDGAAAEARHKLRKRILTIVVALLVIIGITATGVYAFISSEWFLGINGDTVGIYQGVNAEIFGIDLYKLVSSSVVEVEDLSESLQSQLEEGIRVEDEEEARETLDDYRAQIDEEKERAAEVASDAAGSSDDENEDADTDDETSSDETEADSDDSDATDADSSDTSTDESTDNTTTDESSSDASTTDETTTTEDGGE